MSRFTVTGNLHVQPDTEIEAKGMDANWPGWLSIGGNGSEIAIHPGHDPIDVIATVDRIAAALGELRVNAVRRLGHDPADATSYAYDPADGSPDPVPDINERRPGRRRPLPVPGPGRRRTRLMCHVCELCGGTGWRWTGAVRELCRGCLGSGSPRPIEDHARGPMPQVADPIRTRVR